LEIMTKTYAQVVKQIEPQKAALQAGRSLAYSWCHHRLQPAG
jgi:hypothetical protein